MKLATLSNRAAEVVGSGVSRRGLLSRSAMAATALSVAPVRTLLRPDPAYAQVCGCSGSSCSCGSPVLRRLHRVLLHPHRRQLVPTGRGARRLVEGRGPLALRGLGPVLHGLPPHLRFLRLRQQRPLHGRLRQHQLRVRQRVLRQPQGGLHPLPLRQLRLEPRLPRPHRVPGGHLPGALDARRHLHHHPAGRQQHPVPPPPVPGGHRGDPDRRRLERRRHATASACSGTPPARWELRTDHVGGAAQISFGFGGAGDIPVVGDWDGDGVDGIGVFRPGTRDVAAARHAPAAGGVDRRFGFGGAGDIPVVGDWDGDGRDGIGVYRPSTGEWILRNTASGGGIEIRVRLRRRGRHPGGRRLERRRPRRHRRVPPLVARVAPAEHGVGRQRGEPVRLRRRRRPAGGRQLGRDSAARASACSVTGTPGGCSARPRSAAASAPSSSSAPGTTDGAQRRPGRRSAAAPRPTRRPQLQRRRHACSAASSTSSASTGRPTASRSWWSTTPPPTARDGCARRPAPGSGWSASPSNTGFPANNLGLARPRRRRLRRPGQQRRLRRARTTSRPWSTRSRPTPGSAPPAPGSCSPPASSTSTSTPPTVQRARRPARPRRPHQRRRGRRRRRLAARPASPRALATEEAGGGDESRFRWTAGHAVVRVPVGQPGEPTPGDGRGSGWPALRPVKVVLDAGGGGETVEVGGRPRVVRRAARRRALRRHQQRRLRARRGRLGPPTAGFLQPDRGQFDERQDVFAWCGAGVLFRADYLARRRPLRRAVLHVLRGHRPGVAGPQPGLALPLRPRPAGCATCTPPPASRGRRLFQHFVERNRLVLLAKNAPRSLAVSAPLAYLRSTASYARRDVLRPLLRGRRPNLGLVRAPPALLRRLPHACCPTPSTSAEGSVAASASTMMPSWAGP